MILFSPPKSFFPKRREIELQLQWYFEYTRFERLLLAATTNEVDAEDLKLKRVKIKIKILIFTLSLCGCNDIKNLLDGLIHKFKFVTFKKIARDFEETRKGSNI